MAVKWGKAVLLPVVFPGGIHDKRQLDQVQNIG